MPKKSKKKSVPRNPYVIPMRSKKGGPHKNKSDKRSKESNKIDPHDDTL